MAAGDNRSATAWRQIGGVFILLVAYLALVNAAAFAAFASDKRRAVQGERRIPERMLLRLAILGGTSGALAAQQLLRHKTRKEPFRTQLWVIAALQGLLLIGAAYWSLRRAA